MKKLITVSLALLILLGCVSFTPVTQKAEAFNQSAYDIIEDAIENISSSADISDCMIYYYPYSDDPSPELSEIFDRLFNERPDFFYVKASAVKVVYDSFYNSYFVVEVTFLYTMSNSGIQTALTYVNDSIDAIINDIPYLKDLNQTEQALSVHDYLALHFNYDYSLYNTDVYTMLKKKTGVCSAFTGLYTMILRKLGIEVSYSLSDEMNHIWNLVKLDGKWYHVDTTWDDQNVIGRVTHYYFLQSDTAWVNPPEGLDNHYSWTDDYICDDTTYDSYYWSNVITPIVFLTTDTCYYIKQAEDYQSGMLFKRENGVETEIYQINNSWDVLGTSGQVYYLGCFSGLGNYGEHLYFNDSDTIYRYDEKNGVSTVYKTEDVEGCIYGLTVTKAETGCTIQYEVAEDPNSTGTIYTITDDPDCTAGHTYGEWEVTVEPTETSAGTRTRTCSVCGNVEEAVIPALSTENGYTRTVEVEPTYDTEGKAKWVHPDYGTFSTVIPKLVRPSTLDEILNEGLVFDGDYIRGFEVGSKIGVYFTGDYKVVVYAADGTTVVTDNALATGYIIKLYDKDNVCVDTATVVIKGDVNGDGTINTLDYISVRLHLLGISTIEGAKLNASNTNGDTGVNTLDYIALRLYLLGISTINQK